MRKTKSHKDLPVSPMPHILIEDGRHDLLSKFIASGGDIEQLDWSGRAPLVVAVKNNDIKSVSILLAAGANANSRSAGGAPLHTAAAWASESIADLLIKNGAKINNTDIGGRTPLHRAIWSGNFLVAQELLKNKAKVNARDQKGLTPLHLAVIKGSAYAATLLLDNGASIESRTKERLTPLELAISRSEIDTAILLINRNAKVSQKIMGKRGKYNDELRLAIEARDIKKNINKARPRNDSIGL